MWILEALLKTSWPRAVLVPLVAPEIVSEAASAGIGQCIDVKLGGVRDHRYGTSLTMTATVENVFDAKFVMSGHIGKNMPIDMGRSAVLQQNEIRVIVTSRSGAHFAPEFFQAAGFDPMAASVLVAKSPCGFRAVYEKHAQQILNVRAPGCAPSDFWNYPFHNIPRPLWPWDEIDAWQADPNVIQL